MYNTDEILFVFVYNSFAKLFCSYYILVLSPNDSTNIFQLAEQFIHFDYAQTSTYHLHLPI